MRALGIFLLLCALVAVVTACGDNDEGSPSIPGAAVAIDDPFSGGYPTYEDEATGLRVVFGTPDLGAGRSRVSFALFDDEGIVSEPTVDVRLRHYGDDPRGDYEAGPLLTLPFAPFPNGGRGIYTGTVDLDRSGLWAFEVRVPSSGGAEVVFPVVVAETPVAPAVGAVAPASEQRTASDVESLQELTTSIEPDPTLYDMTIAGALERGTPFVVTFASPAFCTNALCGPQVEVLSELAVEYGDRAEFIHVELYENPLEIRGDFSVARRTPVLEEWGVHTDEWTFVVDAAGIVTARFEGFAPRAELEEALRAALDGSAG